MTTQPSAFREIFADGTARGRERAVAVERPISIEFNGIGYAVMMATPADLADLAYGFAASERLIARRDEIVDVDIADVAQGVMLRVTLTDACVARVAERVRHRVAETSCGLCGIENLEQALRPLPRVAARATAAPNIVFRALGEMRAWQPLNAATGAVHAAMACDADGAILLAREDVGRHNAFDKLIGAMLCADMAWGGGFALLSSRCSYDLVEKAALAGCAMLATVSAPTDLALARAAEAGIALVSLARSDSLLLAEL